MKKCRRGKSRGGTLVLKKKDESLCQRVRKLGGDKVGVVPIDVSKLRVAAMVTDFYGNVLSAPEVFPVTADGLLRLDRRIRETQEERGLKLMVIGLEQTGRLHEPVRRALQQHWEIKMIHPLVTRHLRQGISRDIKTDGMDLDAQARAVIGCYGTPLRPLPVAYERWRALHRAREQLVDERAALKLHMHERIHAVLPCFAAQFDNLWTSPAALALIRELDSPAVLLKYSEQGLVQRLREQGVRCTRGKAEALLAWAADAASPTAGASTEAAILHTDLDHLAFLGRRVETCEIEMLRCLVQTPFILLLSAAGISHVLGSGLGAAAGPMEFYATARNLSGRAGLYEQRYQSDETDLHGHRMARGEPFLRDVLMKCGHCLIMAGGAFFAWGQKHRNNEWSEKEIVAAMANRFCRIAHAMILRGQTFRHPDAKPGVSILGKLLNVAADLGLDGVQCTELALQAVARIPHEARQVEISELQTGDWKQDNRPREHGASPCTTAQISRDTVPTLLARLNERESKHDIASRSESWSP